MTGHGARTHLKQVSLQVLKDEEQFIVLPQNLLQLDNVDVLEFFQGL